MKSLLLIGFSLFITQAVFVSSVFSASLPLAFKGPSVLDDQIIEARLLGEKKGLVVVFISAVCPCSNSHINELKSLAADYPQFQFVGIHSNMDEEKESSINYFKNAALPFPVLRDDKSHWANEFKASKTPHAFVLTPNQKLVYQGGVSSSHDFGSAEHKYLREALVDLAANRAVKTPKSRSLGCAISR